MKLSEIKQKAFKIYESQEIFRSFLEGREIFPLVLSLPKIKSTELSQNFSVHRAQIENLVSECQALGIELIFKNVNHRSLGTQLIPQGVCFQSRDIFLDFLSKQKEFDLFKRLVDTLVSEFSSLKEFARKSPDKILEYKTSWPKLISVCQFLVKNRQLNLYIRQLEIPGVDTKFIEAHKRILSELLNMLLVVETSKDHLPELAVEFFEERYGLRKEEPRLRFRLLDSLLRNHFFGLEDIETTATALAQNEIHCDTVLIVENKITGLCIPSYEKAMVFFELGYKAGLLKKISWLQNKRVIYWGDIDTHGFHILSQLRSYFPHIESRLMDQETLKKYELLWSTEDAPYTGECPHLTDKEQELFQDLKWERLGKGVRLEQERIALSDLYLS